MARSFLRSAQYFLLFFVSLVALRLFGLHLQVSELADFGPAKQILIDELGVATCFFALFLSWPLASVIGFAVAAALYVVSEHHMAIQGVYLRPRNLLDERILRPELTSCYASSISFPFIIAAGFIVVTWLWLGVRRRRNAFGQVFSSRKRMYCLAGGCGAFGGACVTGMGPIAIFMFSLWHQVVTRGSLADFTPTVGTFSQVSSYPSAPLSTPVRPTTASDKMNVVVIHIESLGDVSGRANGVPVMTALQRLAKTGVSWSNAYGVAPYSSKAILATQSGRYPPNVRDNPFGLVNSTDYQCMASDFKRAEYRTAYFTADNFSFYGTDRLKKVCTYDLMRDAKTYSSLEPGYQNSLGADERALFEAAHDWIRSSSQNFFLSIQTLLPHYPYRTPPDWSHPKPSGGWKNYHDAIAYVDHNLNNFLDKLESEGLIDSTLIVVMGDHGEAFEQHPKNRIHSLFLYEENIRVPLIISNPRLFTKAQTAENLASLVDIAATVYDLTGVQTESPRHDGRSLFESQDRRMVFMSTAYSSDILALRDGVFKFIWMPETKEGQLYNLKVDPGERDNLVSSFPGRVRSYVNALASWDAHTKNPGTRVSPERSPLAFLRPDDRTVSF